MLFSFQSVELTSASQRSTFSAHRSVTHVVALPSTIVATASDNIIQQTFHTKYGAVSRLPWIQRYHQICRCTCKSMSASSSSAVPSSVKPTDDVFLSRLQASRADHLHLRNLGKRPHRSITPSTVLLSRAFESFHVCILCAGRQFLNIFHRTSIFADNGLFLSPPIDIVDLTTNNQNNGADFRSGHDPLNIGARRLSITSPSSPESGNSLFCRLLFQVYCRKMN